MTDGSKLRDDRDDTLVDHEGRPIDFGRTASDYSTHRPDFPESLFERASALGWLRGPRTLDLGTGTGAVARALARRGLVVTGLDVSPEMVEAARARSAGAGALDFVVGRAEATGRPEGELDLVTAGQCWWWFDPKRTLAEVRRILKPNGRLLIMSFCYLAAPETIASRTEAIILHHNPGWRFSGMTGFFPEHLSDLERGGFVELETFSYDLEVPFSREAWRGRVRACNGVAATLDEERVIALDRDLEELLAPLPEPLSIRHRIFVATGVQG
ncbi:MAG: class I SAM-dependent methyltransferase [Deltaproteobacteria bacterium]|nr:class I SAM-dependent methyltransferase [Deltaproteobacteria bacterium]